MTGSLAYRTLKAAIQTMDKAELKECIELGQKVLGEMGVVSGTSARGKKSPVYMRVVKGVDTAIRNGYSISGDFVNRGSLPIKAGSDYVIAVARGKEEYFIMVGKHVPGASHKFMYPSGIDGLLQDIAVEFEDDNWGSVHAFLVDKGVPSYKHVNKPPSPSDEVALP
jgi:hypothetical protein